MGPGASGCAFSAIFSENKFFLPFQEIPHTATGNHGISVFSKKFSEVHDIAETPIIPKDYQGFGAPGFTKKQ